MAETTTTIKLNSSEYQQFEKAIINKEMGHIKIEKEGNFKKVTFKSTPKQSFLIGKSYGYFLAIHQLTFSKKDIAFSVMVKRIAFWITFLSAFVAATIYLLNKMI